MVLHLVAFPLHILYSVLASSPGHSHFYNDEHRERGEPGTRRNARDARDRSEVEAI